MSPPRAVRLTRNLVATVRKEIRRMPSTLIRFLDAMSHITVVFLALYVGLATVGLGA